MNVLEVLRGRGARTRRIPLPSALGGRVTCPGCAAPLATTPYVMTSLSPFAATKVTSGALENWAVKGPVKLSIWKNPNPVYRPSSVALPVVG